MVPSSIIRPWSRTSSRLITLWKLCCSVLISRESCSSCENGMTQTSLSSSATALQVCASVPMPSMPRISPAIWKPVTWSRPSSSRTSVLKKPVRTA